MNTLTRQRGEVGQRPIRSGRVARTAPEPKLDRLVGARDAQRFSPPEVLQLQRTAGNSGVSTLMTEGGPTIQRGLFDVLGGLLGGTGALQGQAAGLAGRGVEAGVGALGSSLGGPFGAMLAGAGSGLGGVASSLVGGNTAGALSGLQGVGTSVAGPAAQTAMGMLGGAIGGPAGGLVSGLGGSVGEGLTSIISGGSPMAAGMGVLGAAAPGLQEMAAKFLGGI